MPATTTTTPKKTAKANRNVRKAKPRVELTPAMMDRLHRDIAASNLRTKLEDNNNRRLRTLTRALMVVAKIANDLAAEVTDSVGRVHSCDQGLHPIACPCDMCQDATLSRHVRAAGGAAAAMSELLRAYGAGGDLGDESVNVIKFILEMTHEWPDKNFD